MLALFLGVKPLTHTLPFLVLPSKRRISGHLLTSRLWEVMLKALLGVTHDLVAPNAVANDLADYLCIPLLRVLVRCLETGSPSECMLCTQ